MAKRTPVKSYFTHPSPHPPLALLLFPRSIQEPLKTSKAASESSMGNVYGQPRLDPSGLDHCYVNLNLWPVAAESYPAESHKDGTKALL